MWWNQQLRSIYRPRYVYIFEIYRLPILNPRKDSCIANYDGNLACAVWSTRSLVILRLLFRAVCVLTNSFVVMAVSCLFFINVTLSCLYIHTKCVQFMCIHFRCFSLLHNENCVVIAFVPYTWRLEQGSAEYLLAFDDPIKTADIISESFYTISPPTHSSNMF